MSRPNRYIFLLVFKVLLLALFLAPFVQSAWGLDEIFHIYAPPRGLSMGNALTADSRGHLANFYNPAGHAKMKARHTEWHLVDAQLFGGLAGYSRILGTQSTSVSTLTNALQSHPAEYTYFRANAITAVSRRGFGLAILTSREYAAESDGTNVDISSRWDTSFSFGVGRNFFGNYLKLGAVGRAILRNQTEGVFAHTVLATSDGVAQNSTEGYAVATDIGAMLTLPYHSLPTFAVTWKDLFNTHFTAARVLNTQAIGAPANIDQSVNASFSLHPAFSHKWRLLMAIEIKNIQNSTILFRKKMHAGIELNFKDRWFFRIGANQYFLTGGVALHLPGGNFEVGTYAVDVGQSGLVREDRRYFLRYTLGFS